MNEAPQSAGSPTAVFPPWPITRHATRDGLH